MRHLDHRGEDGLCCRQPRGARIAGRNVLVDRRAFLGPEQAERV